MKHTHTSLDDLFAQARATRPSVAKSFAFERFLRASGTHANGAAAGNNRVARLHADWRLGAPALAVLLLGLLLLTVVFHRAPAPDPTRAHHAERAAATRGTAPNTTRDGAPSATNGGTAAADVPTAHAQAVQPAAGERRAQRSSVAPAVVLPGQDVAREARDVHVVLCRPPSIESVAIFDIHDVDLRRLGIVRTHDGHIMEQWDPAHRRGRFLVHHGDGSVSRRIGTTARRVAAAAFLRPLFITGSDGARIDDFRQQDDTAAADAHRDALRGEHTAGDAAAESYHRDVFHAIPADAIPIRVYFSPKIGGGAHAPYLLYWYAPTHAFVQRLRTASLPLPRQLPQQAMTSADPAGLRDTPLEAFLCPATVKPDEPALVQYTLEQPSRVSISVFNIHGACVQDLSTCEHRSEGTWENRVLLRSMPPGVYQLAVSTDRGEKSIQTLFLEP